MTLGEKIKDARINASLTQEELAGKIMISRQAVSKWEADKGIPDINNLKALAKTLNVSVDYLIDDGSALDMNVLREPVDMTAYGKGGKSVIKDRIVRSKHPDAQIFKLIANEIMTKSEKRIDTAVWLLSPLMDVIKLSKQFNNIDNEFYLVEQGEEQYLVTVTSEFMESRRLASRITEKKFTAGNYTFKKQKLLKD